VLANIDAMELAVEEASGAGDITVGHLTAVHGDDVATWLERFSAAAAVRTPCSRSDTS
jgi:hypothetical protein